MKKLEKRKGSFGYTDSSIVASLLLLVEALEIRLSNPEEANGCALPQIEAMRNILS